MVDLIPFKKSGLLLTCHNMQNKPYMLIVKNNPVETEFYY